MNLIESQKEEESLESLVSTDSDVDALDLDAAEEYIASLKEEEDENVEMDEDNPEPVSEPSASEMDSEDVREGGVEEATTIHRSRFDGSSSSNKTQEEEPVEGLLGSSTFSSDTHVAPQVLEEAHQFLNRYGVNTEGLSPKEVMEKIDKIHAAKAESAQVLSRGQALDGIERLLTFVPEGFIGEFMRENDMDINRAKALGFKVLESEEANLASSTGKADGLVRCADQILMIIPEERHIANRLIKAERLAERRKAHDFQGGAPIDQSGSHHLFPLIKL